MDRTYLQKLFWRITAVVMVVIVVALAGISFFTQRIFEAHLLPDFTQKAVTVGASARSLILRAVDYGIDYRQLYGVDAAFAELRQDNPELAYIGLTDAAGQVLYESGVRAAGAAELFWRHSASAAYPADISADAVRLQDQYLVSLPLLSGEKRLGMIHLGLAQAHINGILTEGLLDIVVVLLVALFFTFELLHFIAGGRLPAQFGATAASEEATLDQIRAPLFVFLLAEEMTRSFVPSFANHLLVAIPGLSKQVVIGLPIMLFMLIVALGQPYLGPWSERVGRRRAMLTGAALTTFGFIATALAGNLYHLLLWRSVCAVGYAMVFVAAQGHVLDHTDKRNRTRGFALFVGAFMVAIICGPPIGGILADNIGYRWSFAVSAMIVAISVPIFLRLPPGRGGQASSEGAMRLADLLKLVTNGRFMALAGLAAVTAKIILTAVCFYLIPLYIVSLGGSQAMAGRMLLAYAMVMFILVPLAARLGDMRIRRDRLVALGLCISGLSPLIMLISGSVWMVFFMVLLLGLGQALAIAAQGVLVGDLCADEIRQMGEGAVYGVYRLLERTGNALGPLLASILLSFLDFAHTFATIGAIVLLSGFLFALASGALKAAAPLPSPVSP